MDTRHNSSTCKRNNSHLELGGTWLCNSNSWIVTWTKIVIIFLNFAFQILIHIGLLSNENKLHFAEEAGKGGPLGELVQWSDLITSLYILGHDITVTADLLSATRQVCSWTPMIQLEILTPDCHTFSLKSARRIWCYINITPF